MSFNTARRQKNRNLNSGNKANYGSSKIDKPSRIKNINDFQGVYSNPDFMYVNTSLIGTLANILHKDGHTYEGVFNTFSPDFAIVLNTVSKVVSKPESSTLSPNIGSLLASLTAKNEFLDTVIFKLQDIVMLSIPNVNLDFAIKSSFTDTEISKFNPSLLAKEKDLVPWDCNEDGEDGSDLMLNDDNDDGWDANDMFKLNEKKYNVATTYTESMEGYTVPLDKNAEDYEAREAEANRIAQIIENDAASKDRLAKEDGDEEDKFSAVQRPVMNEHPGQSSVNKSQPTNYNQNNSNSSTPLNQHSRHDGSMNSMGRNRGKNNANTSPGNLSSANFNSSLSRPKNQSLNTSGGSLQQQQQSYHHFNRSSKNGPMQGGRLNPRLDQQHSHEDKDHRNENRLMHNDQQQQLSGPQQPLPQRVSHNSAVSSGRRLLPQFQPAPPIQKREETTHNLKKFSTDFKLAINQPASNSQQQQLDNKENIKDLAKEGVKLPNTNRIDGKEPILKNEPVPVPAVQMERESINTSNKSANKPAKDEVISQTNKQPLLDKPPKDKSPSADRLNSNNDQSTSDKVSKQQQPVKEQQQQSKSSTESPRSNEPSVESSTEESSKPDREQTATGSSQPEPAKQNVETSSQASECSKASSNTSSGVETAAEKTLKKSTLNPNAKEFVFNPKANPYTPKFVATYPPAPVNQANPAASMPVPTAVNPQLAFQPHHLAHPNPMHGQPTAVHPASLQQQQMQIGQMGTVQHAGGQQIVTPVLHQPLMAHPAQMQTAGGHQMLPFPHLMSPQSIQFVTNPQNSIHPHSHHQNVHHAHQTSPYIIPASAVPNSTASMPNAQLANNASAIVNYGQPGPPANPNQSVNVNQPPQQTGGQPNSNPRSNRKTGQYHNPNANANQRSNNLQQANPNVQVSNQPPQIPNAHVVNASNSAVYSQIHLPPNFNPGPPNAVNASNPGAPYQIYHPQFQAHHNPHTRLMSPQMVHPGMTYTAAPDPATIQQLNLTYMTNMANVHHQFVAVPPPQSNTPSSVQSPVPMVHSHLSGNASNCPPSVSTPPTSQHCSTSSNGSQQSSNSQSSPMIIAGASHQYAAPANPAFIIAQPPSLGHLTGVQQTSEPPSGSGSPVTLVQYE